MCVAIHPPTTTTLITSMTKRLYGEKLLKKFVSMKKERKAKVVLSCGYKTSHNSSGRTLPNYEAFYAALFEAKKEQDAKDQPFGLCGHQNQNERKAIAAHAQRLRALYAKSKDSQLE
tara:strand:- start:7811 stop:8161 length:351 start_codon:yes stop_codon:yes gene_type:complete